MTKTTRGSPSSLALQLYVWYQVPTQLHRRAGVELALHTHGTAVFYSSAWSAKKKEMHTTRRGILSLLPHVLSCTGRCIYQGREIRAGVAQCSKRGQHLRRAMDTSGGRTFLRPLPPAMAAAIFCSFDFCCVLGGCTCTVTDKTRAAKRVHEKEERWVGTSQETHGVTDGVISRRRASACSDNS